MSLEAIIKAAVSESDGGLTRDELLAKVRRHDSEQNIMRMLSRMLAGNRLQYSSAGRYTYGPPTPADASSASAAADGRRTKTRDRILEFIGSEMRTTRQIMDGCELAENCVGHHLRTLMAEGVLQKTATPEKGKAPRYHRPDVQTTQGDALPPAPALHATLEKFKAAANNAQTALQQFSAALTELQQQADALPASDS